MKNKVTGKKFSIISITLVILMLSITAVGGYFLDPAMYYRITDYKTYCTEQYTTAGILKNHSAEIAVIGSSMMQNTNVDLVEKEFGKEAIKYTLSGMNIDEITMLVNKAIQLRNNVDTFVINLDLTMFNTKKKSPYDRFPKYMYDSNKINDVKYLLGYDTWIKFIPFNALYNFASNLNNPITNKFQEIFKNVTNVDLMGNWGLTANFGDEIVKNNYKNGSFAVSKQDTNEMLNRMKERFDNNFYNTFKDNNEKEFNFVFPPYSILMWLDVEKEGNLDILLEFKKYIVQRLSGLENVKIYDFQDYEGILDLDNYKDTTHYSPEYNDMIISKIKDGKDIIDINNLEERVNNIKNLVHEFKEENKEWVSDREN